MTGCYAVAPPSDPGSIIRDADSADRRAVGVRLTAPVAGALRRLLLAAETD